MDTTNSIESFETPGHPQQTEGYDIKTRSVRHCIFRGSKHESEETQQLLTGLHKTLARNLRRVLESYLRTELRVSFRESSEVSTRTYLGTLMPSSYISILKLDSKPHTVVLECAGNLSSLIIDLLLGGTTDTVTEAGRLSELEEELMLDAVSVMLCEVEKAWSLPSASMHSGGRIEASELSRCFRAGEALTLAVYEVEVAGFVCLLKLLIPAAVAGILFRQLASSRSSRPSRLAAMPLPIRDRILDCQISIAANLPNVEISVRDLMALRPGGILNLHLPVDSPSALILEERQIFEATIVRNQLQKAAQVGRNTIVL